jgi:hypothetical protein
MFDVYPDDLVVGQSYRVEWDDCCAKGHFVARLIEKRYDVTESPTYLDALIFNNGVTIDCGATSAVSFGPA